MKRVGLSRLKSLEPAEPVVRYERELPGELIHIDTKRLGKIKSVGHRITGVRRHDKAHHGQGWDAVHLAIDDHSRVAFARIKVDETKESCVAFLREAIAFYASIGVKVEGVMTDNGSGYQRPTTWSALNLASGTSELSPTHPRPMARLSASSRPVCASGPTSGPTGRQRRERLLCSPSSITTTGIGHTRLSLTSLP